MKKKLALIMAMMLIPASLMGCGQGSAAGAAAEPAAAESTVAADAGAETTEGSGAYVFLDEDLGAVEDDFYDDECDECDGDCDNCDDDDWDDDYDFDDDDDELYEVTCPTCGDTILLDEGMIEEGSMNCPNCNELLEFDYDNLTIEDFEDSEDEEAAEKAEDKKDNK